MRRKLFTFLAAVSLLLCLTTAAMWVRSYHAADVVKWDRPVSHAMYHLRRLLCAGGVLTYTREDTGYPAGERIAPPWPPVHVYRLGGILIIRAFSIQL